MSLHDGKIRSRQPFESAQPRAVREEGEGGAKRTVVPPAVDYREEVVQAIQDRGSAPFAFGRKLAEDDDTPATVIGHVIRWRETTPTRQHSDVVRFWFEAGPTSEDGIVVDLEGGSDIDLAGKATLHPYRASLITHPGFEFAVLAVEVRGRSCPKDQLVRALTDSTSQPWRLRIRTGVADKAAVLRFLDRSIVSAVTFIEHGYAKDGQRKAPQRKQLRVDEFVGGAKQVLSAVRKWVQAGGTNLTAAAAEEIKAIVVTEEVGIPFTDVSIELQDGKVQRTFRPSSDYSQFAYLLGSNVVEDALFFEACEEAAAELLEDVQSIAAAAADGDA